jgi:hypothetical protein
MGGNQSQKAKPPFISCTPSVVTASDLGYFWDTISVSIGFIVSYVIENRYLTDLANPGVV